MHRVDPGLGALIAHARKRGFLTYQEVDEYLPDEGGEARMMDHIIYALEDFDVPLINDPEAPATIGDMRRL